MRALRNFPAGFSAQAARLLRTQGGRGRSARGRSVRAAPRDDRRQRSQQDLDVAGEGPAGYVLVVEADHLLEGALRATVDLPGAGQAGAQLEPAQVPVLVQGGGLGEDQWAGADEAHLTLEDVEQLWQLVDRVTAQEAADRGDTRVAADLEHDAVGGLVELLDLRLAIVGVQIHRAELDQRKAAAAPPRSRLAEEDGSARLELDRDCRGDHHGAEEAQQGQ